ncbi:MAG: CapA family protein [Alphaproteobacteria bacterium]|nr:CapA family protein [Alphaproteobacteria bacterium]
MIALALGCAPDAAWPERTETFPWVYTPEEDLPPYADVRVETETWVPLEDLEQTALYVQKSVFHRPSAPDEVLEHFDAMRPTLPPLGAGDAVLSFVGDVMMFEGDPTGFADAVVDRMPGLRAGNLETPVVPGEPVTREGLTPRWGLYAFNSRPALLDALPLDVVQLVNNHALDLGDPGLERTRQQVVGRGMLGVGLDGAAPIVVVDGLPVGFVAATWGVNVHPPVTSHDLGIVPFGHLDEDIDLSPVARDIAAVRRRGAHIVVLMVHWGYEYEYYPDPHFLQLGRRLVQAGADVVVGSGPHAVEPAELCAVNRPEELPGIGTCSVRTRDGRPRTAAILYSLGDFGTDLATIPLQVGLIASVGVRDGSGVTGLAWDPVATVTDGPDRRLIALDDLLGDADYAAESERLDALLGTGWRRRPAP